MAKGASTEKAVREIRRKTRRKFSSEEKIRIVLEGLRGEESIATLCVPAYHVKTQAESLSGPRQSSPFGLRPGRVSDLAHSGAGSRISGREKIRREEFSGVHLREEPTRYGNQIKRLVASRWPRFGA